MDMERRQTAGRPGTALALALLAITTPACTAFSTASSGASAPAGLIDAETVRSLDSPAITRRDWIARLGAPDYVSADGSFIAYQRGALFRNVWRSGAGNSRGLATGAARDTVSFYQLIGVWLTSDDHVRKTQQFMAPCGACEHGQALLSDSEIDAWRQSTAATPRVH
jgi:hypothetical protein